MYSIHEFATIIAQYTNKKLCALKINLLERSEEIGEEKIETINKECEDIVCSIHKLESNYIETKNKKLIYEARSLKHDLEIKIIEADKRLEITEKRRIDALNKLENFPDNIQLPSQDEEKDFIINNYKHKDQSFYKSIGVKIYIENNFEIETIEFEGEKIQARVEREIAYLTDGEIVLNKFFDF